MSTQESAIICHSLDIGLAFAHIVHLLWPSHLSSSTCVALGDNHQRGISYEIIEFT